LSLLIQDCKLAIDDADQLIAEFHKKTEQLFVEFEKDHKKILDRSEVNFRSALSQFARDKIDEITSHIHENNKKFITDCTSACNKARDYPDEYKKVTVTDIRAVMDSYLRMTEKLLSHAIDSLNSKISDN
jgi:vacuolar-type H+-ATPase subunit H